MLFGADNDDASESAPKLPDAAICRALRADGPGMVACLADRPRDCKHASFFNDAAYCLHPDREAIIARTQARLSD